MVYDSSLERAVLFGGNGQGGDLQDTWEYYNSGSRQPAFQFQASAAAAGIHASNMTALRVRAHCGGVYDPYTQDDVGATLLGWSIGGPGLPPGSWNPLASNTAAASSTAPHLPAPPGSRIDWISSSVEEARAYMFERDRTLHFQCRPSGLSGGDDARVALDYIEVRVRYRAP
jgi:hypothetical protein